MNRSKLIASLDYILKKADLYRKHKEIYNKTGKCTYCKLLLKKKVIIEANEYNCNLVCSICGDKYKKSML